MTRRSNQLLVSIFAALGVSAAACKSQVATADAPGLPGNPPKDPPKTPGVPAPSASSAELLPCPDDKGDVVAWPAGEEPDSYGHKPRGVCLAKPANGDCASITNSCVLHAYHCGYSGPGEKIVDRAKTKEPTACCWKVQGSCTVGRPFVVDGVARLPSLVSGDGWSPSLGLSFETSAALADVWARDGLTEHASVASFAQLVLELLALGAPSSLVLGAQTAMGDEIRHAERAFALASAYANAPVAPGPLATHGALLTAPDLADFAARAASEGCIAETIAALQLHASADAAEDPAIAALLRQTANEESEHAVLAYEIVRWAIAKGGAPVRAAVRAVFANAAAHVGFGPLPEPGADLRRHGILSRAERHELAIEALRDVIGPASRGVDLTAS